jgi:hypothetical protein
LKPETACSWFSSVSLKKCRESASCWVSNGPCLVPSDSVLSIQILRCRIHRNELISVERD